MPRRTITRNESGGYVETQREPLPAEKALSEQRKKQRDAYESKVKAQAESNGSKEPKTKSKNKE